MAFAYTYPAEGKRPLPLPVVLIFLPGIAFAILALATRLIIYDVELAPEGLSRKTGTGYLLFVLYFLAVWLSALVMLIIKWRRATGAVRSHLRYFTVSMLLTGAGGIASNLLFPSITGRSTYSWIGPYFVLIFLVIVGHAIIRHHFMELRLVIHRGITLTVAVVISLLPVVIVLAVFWPRLSDHLEPGEFFALLLAIIAVTLLVPPTRDVAGKLLDKYVYRTHANFQRTVREASRALTRVLELKVILSFVSRVFVVSIGSEGAVVYLRTKARFLRATTEKSNDRAHLDNPDVAPKIITDAATESRDLIIADELVRRSVTDASLHAELTQLNWALVLPLLSEDTVIGFIALGPKLSGDPFYPQDLDLLMTLANQAGIAIKNAQLYTQVVLANEYIENIVRTIESGVVAVDEAGHIAMFNRAAEQLTGLSAAQVQDQSVDVLPSSLGALLKSTVADGRERTEPEIQLQVDSVTRPVICTTSPLREPSGAVLGAVAVFSDLTPFKQLESERRRAERLAYFEVLASSLAHEIKNPLVAIKTFAQLIPRRHKDEQFVEEFSRIVTREIGRMGRLVERLRALSRPSDRPKVPLDLREPLAQAVEFLRPAFDEKRIALGTAFGGEPRTVVGDPSELEQLFINLLMNAHEATPPGGRVSVELTVSGEATVVHVADSGPGIPPELLEHVFDPFITSKPRGSGLGLTISAGIAAAHRAKLQASNPPGGGALFTVEFPLATQGGLASEVRDPGMNARA